MSTHALGLFGIFFAVLAGLLFLHHHKNAVVVAGFALMSALFITHDGFGVWADHFGLLGGAISEAASHRRHLLMDLALLIPAFALVAHYFEHSGASQVLAKRLRSDGALLWTVFILSIALDNIAAALIGGTILLAKYGTVAPFRMLVGIIGASNLGGAGSPVGDTTTVMMFISKDPKIPVTELFQAFVGSVPAMMALAWWSVRHGVTPQSYTATSGPRADVVEESGHLLGSGLSGLERPAVNWSRIWPMLAIPGLLAGNALGMPGIGVWVGLILGLAVARLKFDMKIFKGSIPNALFLVVLVAAAEMLPLDEARPQLEKLSRTSVAVLMGLLSPWFDNIPLTAICLRLKGFDWGLLAYTVGFGGSAMWFGSSAGVALGLLFKEVYNTRRWVGPYIAITTVYFLGVACYMGVFKYLVK